MASGVVGRRGGQRRGVVGRRGGRWIVLSPEGFGERWHPGREYEKFCAEGRMLFLSLWPAMAREPTKKELYDRCHEMGDLVVEGLSRVRLETRDAKVAAAGATKCPKIIT